MAGDDEDNVRGDDVVRGSSRPTPFPFWTALQKEKTRKKPTSDARKTETKFIRKSILFGREN